MHIQEWSYNNVLIHFHLFTLYIFTIVFIVSPDIVNRTTVNTCFDHTAWTVCKVFKTGLSLFHQKFQCSFIAICHSKPPYFLVFFFLKALRLVFWSMICCDCRLRVVRVIMSSSSPLSSSSARIVHNVLICDCSKMHIHQKQIITYSKSTLG